jgi:DNA-binding NtrC family response regulator
MKTILIISENKETVTTIESCFSSDSRVVSAGNIDQALEILREKRYDFVFIDLTILRDTLPGDDYKTAFGPFRRLYATLQIIVLAPKNMVGEAIRAKLAGAGDFITYPINPAEVRHVTESIQESLILESELDYLRDQFWEKDSLDVIQTKSPKMKELFDKIRSVAPTKSAVLLVGETGTGKSLFAKLIHRHSNRRNDQFISVHCGAIPDTLLESELFGHEKGAFTGAIRRKLGKFEIAHGGTIFLDEIGTLTPAAQIKLLQVLQDGTIQRVGGEETIQVDVRVISATNADLGKMCEEGFFRKDLYYRLNVFPIEIPPLREREEDISLLAKGFLKRMNRMNTKEVHAIHPKVINALINYSWPGNIRELENLIERAYILETSNELNPDSFPTDLMETDSISTGGSRDPYLSLAQVRKKGIEDIERTYLRELLARNNGKIRTSAEVAGITTRQLHKLMVKYGLKKETFK